MKQEKNRPDLTIRRTWSIDPRTRVKDSDKKYSRENRCLWCGNEVRDCSCSEYDIDPDIGDR